MPLGLIVILFLGFVIFFIYFTIKQIEFILNAIPLYRDIVAREDRIINLLQDIKQQSIDHGNFLKELSLRQGKTVEGKTSSSEGKIQITQKVNQNLTSSERAYSMTKTKVYTRYSASGENAKVVEGQKFNDETIPLEVVMIDEDYSETQKISQQLNCPSCNAVYKVEMGSSNVIFKCIKCDNYVMVMP